MKNKKKSAIIGAKLSQDIKRTVNFARKNNLILSHSEAFKRYPTSQEQHKGKSDYFLK